MPRSLLSTRYRHCNFARLKAKTKMSLCNAKPSTRSRIWDPLKREIKTRSMMKSAVGLKGRLQSHQLSLLQSEDWLTSDLLPFTVRYELEQRHNIELMARYGDDKSEVIVSYDEDSEEENEYFDPKPRRIDFDHMEIVNQNVDGGYVSEENVSKPKKKKTKKDKLSGDDEEDKNLVCDICKKTFGGRWALNSHMLVHSGDKPYRCTYKACTKQYADRSNLRAHQRSKMHHEWNIFCNQCTKPFSEQRYMNLHSLSACRKYLASISKKVPA
ncbi:hypothetical protein HA402_007065 [Bradysia odoriphaga]|nr:hypothetical protein HA402_007065 [Bradysia odoriphaga]